MLLNLSTIAIAIIGIIIFERAYEKGDSLIWHATKFWTILLITVLQVIPYWEQLYTYIPLSMCVYWISFDILWNKQHDKEWYYAGDKKGNYIELFISWLHPKKRISYDMFTLSVKAIVLIISIIIAS